MLRTLSIQSFAIIDKLDIEFGAGLNVLTGETGAGKSIIMDALNLLLGGRAGAEMVRSGAKRAVVDALFDEANTPEMTECLTAMGFEPEEGQLFLSREISAVGKSVCRLNGRLCTVAQLKEIGEGLVDLHGQHEHQSLLRVHGHIDILDDWGGKTQLALRERVREAHAALTGLRREREELERDSRERAHLLDLYQFQVKEIREAELQPGEDEQLGAEHKRVANAQTLAETAQSAALLLSGEDGGGALESVVSAVRELEGAVELDDRLKPLLDTVRTSSYELAEAQRDLLHYRDNVEFDPERLASIEDRLNIIRRLKKKYGSTMQEVVEYGETTAAKFEAMEQSEERGARLEIELAAATAHLKELCAQLTHLRKEAADRFAKVTLAELGDLAMEKALFDVSITPAEPGEKGADRVEFVIAANPGEPLRPLAKVASGGEISRVMLAVKSAMARKEALPTMVFDEIDMGVGGRTADAIASKLALLAANAQVLCITHLAQIAGKGTHHLYIEKREVEKRTVVAVAPLTEDQRVGEIARMIGGSNITEAVLSHAREMLAR